MAPTSSQLQRVVQDLVFFVAIFSVTNLPVAALRYPFQSSFNISNLNCTDYSVDNTCVNPYLTDEGAIDPLYVFGFAARGEFPDAFKLSVIWVHFGIPEYKRIVWSANRNRPVDSGAWFTFVANGSLVLYDSDGSKVWSTQTDNMGAMGLDLSSTTGELILYGSQNQTIWSTFSHPTDTIVAGQQLVWGMQLVSGKSNVNNSEGAYSLVMEPAGLVLYASLPEPQPYFVWNYFGNNSEDMRVSFLLQTCHYTVALTIMPYGLLGVSFLDANRSLNPVPANNSNHTSQALCNFTTSDFSLSQIEFNSYPNTANTTFMVLQSDGNLKVHSFNPGGVLTDDYNFFGGTLCDLPESCGAYGVCKANGQCECPSFSVPEPNSFVFTNSSGPTNGCSYTGGPYGSQCPAHSQVHMGQVNGVDYYPNKFTAAGINTSMADCESLCMNNCSCTASFYDSEPNTCYLESEPLSSMISTGNPNLTGFVKISGAAPKKKSSSNLAVGIGVGVSCFVGVLVVISGYVLYLSRRKAKLARKSKEDEFLETLPGLPPRYSKKELEGATIGFTKKLGSGGFGTVYEGKLTDGSKIAVKKLQSSNTMDFRAEMATLGSIHHNNLVRLRGFCAEGVENMLVYEYMPNGSLDKWLFGSDAKETSLLSDSLDWGTRFKIALGTARGLAYLHEDCSERIIHLDIKPQNILLDNDFNPKVADFGLSKLVDRDISIVMTKMRGTPGYLAPEWLLQAAVTEKTDVYSYGIVLLELVGGRKCLDSSKQDPKQRYLPTWLLQCIFKGNIFDIVDPKLDTKNYDEEQVTKVVLIALQCIQDEMVDRPSMGVVVQMLEGFIHVPALQIDGISTKYRFAHSLDSDISSKEYITSSSSKRVLSNFSLTSN